MQAKKDAASDAIKGKYEEIKIARASIDRIEMAARSADAISGILRAIDGFILENNLSEKSIEEFLGSVLKRVLGAIPEIACMQVCIFSTKLQPIADVNRYEWPLEAKLKPETFDEAAISVIFYDASQAFCDASGKLEYEVALLPIRFQKVFVGVVWAVIPKGIEKGEISEVLQGVFQQLSILVSIYFEKTANKVFSKMWDTIINSSLSPEDCFDALAEFIPQLVPDFPKLRPKDHLIQILVPEERYLHIRATNGTERRDTPVSMNQSVVGYLLESDEKSLLIDPTQPPYANLFRDFFSSEIRGTPPPKSELAIKLEVGKEDFIGVLNIECPKPNQISSTFQRILEAYSGKLASLVYAFEERRSIYADWAKVETETSLRYASLISQAFEHQWAPSGSAVRLQLDWLKSRTQDPEIREVISKAIEEHSKYTRQVADFTDGFESMLVSSDYFLCELVSDALSIFRGAERHRISELGGEVFQLAADPEACVYITPAIKIYITSILENSLKSMEEKAKKNDAYRPNVTIKISEREASRASIASSIVSLEVRDNGVGVSSENLKSLRRFRPGTRFRQAADGRGVGLTAVEKYVREFDGWVDLDSVEDEWFSVTLSFLVF
ncbi:sensor histidine kinase [Primorskyibacter sp. 2E233]|uniref:sensor histidine kinase n=1 Tax=Primorskyibacter sp. 2E233 TaxID=3413431 RepID=UPI003BF0F7AE